MNGIQREWAFATREKDDPRSQPALAREQHGKEHALRLLTETRGDLVEAAFVLAVRLAKERGEVTSPEVLAALHEGGYGAELRAVDSRWIGAVFGRRRGFRRVGYRPLGSHGRPVSVWALEEEGAR